MRVTRAQLRPHLRTPVNGGYHYSPLSALEEFFTAFPPAVGDLFSLPDDDRMFRVVDRHWHHPATGSPVWRVDGQERRTILELILEEANVGLFTEEVLPEDED